MKENSWREIALLMKMPGKILMIFLVYIYKNVYKYIYIKYYSCKLSESLATFARAFYERTTSSKSWKSKW